VISCIQPFGQWNRQKYGGREYRGLRTLRYTFARDLEGPWLLFDNHADPYQLQNLVGESSQRELVDKLDDLLSQKLEAYKDEFLPGLTYVKQYGYPELNEWETVPYRN
ncbi:MAG: sulfatase, partial [Bacteroidota bacterium]